MATYYRNSKALQARASGGQFRKLTGADFGIGECPECHALTTQPEQPASFSSGFIDPVLFNQWRQARECGACGWMNNERRALGDVAPKDEKPKESVFRPLPEPTAPSIDLTRGLGD